MGHDSRDYEELYESSQDDIIEKLRGTIKEGDCCYAGCHGRMRYDQICFICNTCKRSVHEDTYYHWYAGFENDIVWDEDDYEEYYTEEQEE